MKFINTKYVTVGVITLMLGVLVAFGASRLLGGSTTVQGNVTAFILGPDGKVEGAVLDTGDQLRFGAETGAIVTAQVKVGGAISATGHAGSKSDYGREFRVESMQIGDQTINVMHAKPGPPDGPKRGPKDGPKDGPRGHGPREGKNPPPVPEDGNAPYAPAADSPTNVPPPPIETATANGQVKVVLVGARGEVRGVILSSGEQVDLPKEVIDSGVTIGLETQVGAEGPSKKSDAGTLIRPARLTIGSQTFSFDR